MAVAEAKFVIALLTAAAGLGLAGFDPAGALFAVAAMARGASPRAIIAFTAAVVVGTATFGTVLALTLGPELASIDWSDLLPKGDLAAVIELVVAGALLVWAVARLGHPQARPKRPRSGSGASAGSLVVLGLLFAASAALDPTFVGLVLIASRDEPLIAVAAAQTLWIFLSQVPLVAFATAVALGTHERALKVANRWWERVRPGARIALTVALFVAAAVLAADAVAQLATGEFLIAPESDTG